MRRHILLGFQFGRQFRHRDVRRCLDPLEQSRQMRCQLAAAGWAALSRRLRRARSRHPIGQLHRKACTDIVATSRATSRLPALNFGLNAFPKVNRIWLSHPYWPPCPASILNQTSDSLGIPFRFLFQARRSSKVDSAQSLLCVSAQDVRGLLRPASGAPLALARYSDPPV